ncbi:CRE-DSC-4 protein [Aphelenchoides avenae]|nr:CRE-DSC-4 protein [Aphelenchus avenae]
MSSLQATTCLHIIPGAPEHLITTDRFSFPDCVDGTRRFAKGTPRKHQDFILLVYLCDSAKPNSIVHMAILKRVFVGFLLLLAISRLQANEADQADATNESPQKWTDQESEATEEPKKPEPIRIGDLGRDREKKPFNRSEWPPNLEGKKPTIQSHARLILYDYLYKSETTVFEEKTGPKEAKKVNIEARYEFELLHHDMRGNILARYKLINCTKGPCTGPFPDVYVDFVQGGQSIDGVYVIPPEGRENDTEWKPDWNFLMSLPWIIQSPAKQGEGDEQMVTTPYGLCNYQFSRPQDLRFVRRLRHCEFNMEGNHSLIPEATQFHYDQHVLFRQNKKIDADIVFVDATEHFDIRSPLHDKWNIHVKAYTYLELMNRTRRYIPRFCPQDMDGGECAELVFGARLIGKNWREIPANVKLLAEEAVQKKAELRRALEAYEAVLRRKDVPEESRLRSFQRLVQAVANANADELRDTLKSSLKGGSLTHLLQAVGAVASKEHVAVVRAFAEDLEDSNEVLEAYLNAIPFGLNFAGSLIREFKSWIEEERASKQPNQERITQLLFATSGLLRRRCNSSPSSLNACNIWRDNYVNWFLNATACDTNDVDCEVERLAVLENLPIAPSCAYAKNLVCKHQPSAVEVAALKLLTACDPATITSIIRPLVQTFRDACPTKQSRTASLLALEALSRIVETNHRHVGTYLLRSESHFPEDHEKWAYFYDFVRTHREDREDVDEYWRNFRNFKVFRPSYAQRALQAASSVQRNEFGKLGILKAIGTAKTEFTEGVLKRAVFDLQYGHGKARKDVFKVLFETAGLESLVGSKSNAHNTSAESEGDEEPHASVQLSLLGHRFPPKEIFNGMGNMVSTLWNADGQTFKAHESNVVFRQFRGVFPLVSGYAIRMEVDGAFHLGIYGEAEVSLWNQNGGGSLRNNVSVVLDAKVSLSSSEKLIGQVSTELSGSVSVESEVDAEFASHPASYCATVGHSDAFVRQRYSQKWAGKKQTITRDRHVPGRSFALDARSNAMCRQLFAEEPKPSD